MDGGSTLLLWSSPARRGPRVRDSCIEMCVVYTVGFFHPPFTSKGVTSVLGSQCADDYRCAPVPTDRGFRVEIDGRVEGTARGRNRSVGVTGVDVLAYPNHIYNFPFYVPSTPS